MKIDDLYEYNKGIQDPNSNAKQSNKNDDEMEMEPFSPDEEKDIAKGFKAIGAKLGQPIQNPKMAAKGINKAIQGGKPTPQQLQSKLPIDIQISKAMQTPALRNQLANILKKADAMDIDESSLAQKILNKLTSRGPLAKIKKRSKLLKESDPKLFEINFNKKEIAQQGLDAPVKCGFEAETFFYSVDDSRASDDVDNMSVSDVEYEFGDLPDSAYSDYNDWIMEKAMDEYLPGYIDDWIEENRDEDGLIQDFMNSGNGPTEDAVQEYKEQFAEDDPNEFENREEDGWDDDNWARDLINEEYEYEYEDFLREIANDDDQLRDDAFNECEGDHSMEDWINDQWYSMSAFLDDYGYEYSSESGSVEGVASELYRGWIEKNSKFDEYPEYGEYGSTGVTDRWAVETDSSIDPDEGAGAELISPVFSNAREMLEEMKSLFEWSEGEFGTNSTTGLHITMSWQGDKSKPNKLKMAMLLGDEYLLDVFGRLRNSYTRSQYRNVLKYAEEIDTGKLENFEKLEAVLQKGISRDKFSSINFKGQKDSSSGNELIEFRIAGGRDYNEMYKEVVQACVRYGTIMKAGYEPDAFRQDYIKAVSRLLRKSKEVDPKTAKEFDEINAPIIDSAKELVSKKDYFDVLKSLEISLRHLQEYETLSEPDADKKWKKSVEDFKKGTGRDPSWVGENINEEEITGYIEPPSSPPSKRAPAVLKKAQESFMKAVAILAKDISTGTNRGKPTAKSIRVFRDYAQQLELADDNIQDLLVQQIDDIRPEYNDKENMALLDKGVKALFKKDLIQKPEFLLPQNVDHILKQTWQFAMSDDVNDNTKLDQLVKLLQKVSPHLEYDEIAKSIEATLKSRQENEFVRKMKSGGYGDVGILKTGKITTPGASEELLKFLEPYSGYKHPTSPTHHVNIRSDDRYSQVFQMRLMQRLRERLEHLKGLEIEDPEKANEIKKQLMDIGFELLEGLKPQPDLWDGENSHRRGSDSSQYLAHRDDLESWNTYMDRLAHVQNEIGDENLTYNFTSAYDDYVFSGIHLDRYFRYKDTDGPIQSHFLKELIKERFAAIKKFYTQFDKIFQGEGFVSLKAEIQAKNTLDRRNRDFEKNIRDNAKAKLNVPSHASVFFNEDFLETITDKDYGDREAYLDNHLDDFREPQNSNKVWVIPAAHYGQAEDALSGLELIGIFELSDNYYHSWRKTGYNKILSKFARVHGIPFKDLTNSDKYVHGNSELHRLQKLGIEITRKGDSRAGMPGQDYLIEPEDLANPISNEPIDRGSAMMWNQSDDEEKEMKRFKAFDWSVYPEKMKGLVAKQLKNMKAEQGYYSFKVALEDVLKKVVNGDIDIALKRQNNVDGMAQAAGVEDYASASSNEVAGATNWTNLADYLKIERGVNDQGVMLLKRVYDRYDSDHNWRPESEPDAIGIKRWAAAVKAAYEYIKDGYNVSAGNYFRKNADGSDGDDVSSIYSKQRDDDSGFDVTTDDYEKVREKYRMFNAMMQNGIRYYIMQPDVNRLVSFLANDDNDELFKQAVLNRLIRDQENGEDPNDFQGALARGRMDFQRNESVFDKFDKLTLEEQLRIVNESDVLEKWSQKYKKSINCSNPKGFSQKAHCAGKKKNEGDVSHSLDRRRAQKGKDKYQKVVDVPVSRTGEKFDKFVVVPSESGKVGHMVGMKNGNAQDLGSTTIDMANALVDAYNRGGFSDLPIQKIDMDERKLSKKEKNKKEKYVKGMKKSKGDFEKRYGADAKAVMYATATKMAKENKINTNMKNVFEQFEKLPLEKQLEILHSPVVEGFFSDLDVDMRELSYKAFAKKYPEYAHLHPGAEELSTKPVKMKKAPYNKEQHIKNTYNKFKQQHGEAKAKIMLDKMMQRGYFDKDMSESLLGIDILTRTKKLTENMPNNNKLAILKRLLSKHFPVGDMDMQFQAYLALPIPSMMTAFSRLKSINGPDACARDILSHYAKNRLPDEEVKQLNLNESYIREDVEEDRLDSIMTALKNNPKFAQRVYKMLKLEKGEDGLDIEDKLLNKDTGEEKDHRINKNILRKLVVSLGQLDHDFDEINAFVETYGYVDYVNTELLNKSGVFTIKDMLVGSDKVSKEFVYDLYESLYDFKINISNSNRGPGEIGLALLSPNVEVATVGDIKVNGVEIEVKGEVSTGGGRMVNGIDDFKFSGLEQVKAQLEPFYEKHGIPDEERIYNLKGNIGGGNKQGQAHILDQAKFIEQIKPGAGAEFLKIIVSTYKFVVDSDEEAELTTSFMSMDKPRFLTLVGGMSFKNYAYMLNKKGFNRMLFLNWIKNKVVSCTTDEFSKFSDHLRFTSLDMADSQNGPAVQVSIS